MKSILSILFISIFFACTQSKTNNMHKENKNYSCDIETGTCSQTDGQAKIEELNLNAKKKVKLIYYTDPTCSACWAIVPELKKFQLDYGSYFDI